MTRLTRAALVFACAISAGPAFAASEAAPAESANGVAAAELAAWLAAIPMWDVSGSIAASYGYKDNLLLSFASEESSPFLRGSMDFMLMRIPRNQFDFSLYAETEGSRYLAGKTVKDDARVWLHAEPAYRFSDTFKLTMPVTGYYYDQVFDVSDTEVERVVAALKVTGGMIGPTLRWDFHRSWWVEAQGVGQRKRYDDRVNDGDIGEAAVRLGWVRGWMEAQLAATQRWRDFRSRTQYSAAGRDLPGTALKIAEREGELRIEVTWDEARRWETTTRLGMLEYRDNGSGYLNFQEKKVTQELEWTSQRWELQVAGSAGRVDFDVQTVGLGIDPPSRLRDEYLGELYLGRRLGNRWTLFAAYTWERCRSNDAVASYTVNEGLLGLRWNWEK